MTTIYKQPTRALRDDQDDVPPSKGHTDPHRKSDLDAPEPGRGVLVCKMCRSRITRRDLGMEINGSHRHVLFNPNGDVFELGCFASAKNVVPTGPRTDEYTWFPGFEWQVVVCSGCGTQLGWRYAGRNGGFFGLILTLLREEIGRKP